jgi:aspartyl-tRNA(Asn)/glutamyl-tRNA(Gln) amidotransferase subunit B
MEKGQMRCDVNISVRPEGQKEFGPKVELKNINSPAAIRRAIKHEIERQTDDLERGVLQVQSTRRWDDTQGETQLMRTKEDAHDYRYFPDPDLLPVRSGLMVEAIRATVPESPHAKRARFTSAYGVSDYDASVLASDLTLAGWFEEAARGAKSGKRVANWIINELLATLNQRSLSLPESPVSPSRLRDLTDAIETGRITNAQGKEVYAALLETPATVADIIREKGFETIDDSGWLDGIIAQAMAVDPAKVEEIKSGNAKLLNWLVGQVMKLSQGKANPKTITETLRKTLGLPD